MKLTPELRDRIDAYFESISPEDLFKKSVSVYGFEEIYDFPLSSGFVELNNSLLLKEGAGEFLTSGEDIIPLAA